MYGRYKEKKEQIRMLYNDKEYVKCLQKCLNLIVILDKRDVFNYKLLFYCYYKISTIYSILNNFELSLKYAKKSEIFEETIEDKILVNWTYSYCYYKMNEVENAVKYIQITINECCKIESRELLFQALVHKALLLKDEDLMLESINELKKSNLESDRMDEMYEDMFILYINTNNIHKAQITLHNIKSSSTKEALSQKYIAVANFAN